MTQRKDYPGHIQQRGGSYRVRLTIHGEREEFTVRTRELEDAKAFATNKYAELVKRAGRKAAGLPAVLSFSAFLDEFEEKELPLLRSDGSRRSYRDSFKPFRLYFEGELGNLDLDQIGRRHIKGYLAWRRVHRVKTTRTRNGPQVRAVPGRVSNHTVARDRRVLHRVMAFAVELEYIDANPVGAVPAPKTDKRTPYLLTPAELGRLLEECGDHDMLRMYLLFLAETGARAFSEALWVRWEDVDLADGFIQIVSGRDGHRLKGGKSRWCPITPPLKTALQEHAAAYRMRTYRGRRSPWVFHHTRTIRNHKAGEQIRTLRQGFEGARKRAKLPPRMRMHDLRHRRVTTWLAEGRDVVLVKEAVGHAALATTMGYTHLAKEHLRALVDDPPARREALRDLAR